MAKNPSAYLLLLAIVVLTTATSSSVSAVNLAIGTQAQTVGIVSCRISGSPPLSGQPVVGVRVNLSCDGGRTNLGQAVTNNAGFYNISVDVGPGILFNTTGCAIFLNLPSNCTASSGGPIRIALDIVASIPIVISGFPLVIRSIVILLGRALSLT